MVKYGDWINEAVKMFQAQWQQWIGAAAIMMLFQLPLTALMVCLNLIPMFIKGEADLAKLESMSGLGLLAAGTLSLIGLIMLIFVPPLIAGMYIAAFNQMRTGRFAARDIFKGMHYFWQTNLYFGIVGLLISFGSCFCLIPGIYLWVCSFFAIPILVEKNMSFWAAFNASRDMVSRDFWNFLLFSIIASVISGLGANFCYIGMLVTMPFFYLLHAIAYRDTFGVEGVAAAPWAGITPTGAGGFHFCPKCGAGVVPGGRFCTNCGQLFTAPPNPPEQGA